LIPAPDDVLAEAQADENKQRLRDQTTEAKNRGVFGAPTFFFGDEMFWGNDRLDDAMAFAASALHGANEKTS
jgi:2-hydroxychromene-2-carboxylate isomerase